MEVLSRNQSTTCVFGGKETGISIQDTPAAYIGISSWIILLGWIGKWSGSCRETESRNSWTYVKKLEFEKNNPPCIENNTIRWKEIYAQDWEPKTKRALIKGPFWSIQVHELLELAWNNKSKQLLPSCPGMTPTTKPTTHEPTNIPTETPTSTNPTTESPSRQEPTTSKPTTQEPTTPKPTTQEPEPNPTQDPNAPLNWNGWTIVIISLLSSTCLLCGIITGMGAVYWRTRMRGPSFI